MTRQLCQAVLPSIKLADAIRGWSAISAALSDPPRHRRLQGEEIQELLGGPC